MTPWIIVSGAAMVLGIIGAGSLTWVALTKNYHWSDSDIWWLIIFYVVALIATAWTWMLDVAGVRL